jgi:hypothetical protein
MYAVRLWLSPLRIAQRLAKMECMFQQKEVYEPQQLFTAEKHTDFSVYINFIQGPGRCLPSGAYFCSAVLG